MEAPAGGGPWPVGSSRSVQVLCQTSHVCGRGPVTPYLTEHNPEAERGSSGTSFSDKNPIGTSLNKKEKILTWVTKRSRGMLVFKFSWIEGLKAGTVHLLPWLFLSLCVAITPRQAFPFDCKMEVMNSWLHPSSIAMSTEKELPFFNSSSRSPRTDGHWPIHGSRAHLQKKPCGPCRSSLWLEVSVLDYVQKSIRTSILVGRWRKIFLEKVAFEECISHKLGVVNDRDSTQAGLNRNIGIFFSCLVKKKRKKETGRGETIDTGQPRKLGWQDSLCVSVLLSSVGAMWALESDLLLA